MNPQRIGRIDEPFLLELALRIGRYFFFLLFCFFACELLIAAARDFGMPLRFSASYVSFFLIEWDFLPGMSLQRESPVSLLCFERAPLRRRQLWRTPDGSD